VIVLLSRQELEPTTDDVIDWLDTLGGDWIRLNGEDLTGQESYEIKFNGCRSDAVFRVAGRIVRPEHVRAIWFRRWHSFRDFPAPGVETPDLRSAVDRHLGREMRAITETLYHIFSAATWLTSPSETRLSKMAMLQLAAQSGLPVPSSLVTSRKASLQAFKDRHERIVTKCIGDVEVFPHAGRSWGLYTAELTQSDIDSAPESFFPTLVQERVDKSYEVRAFFLGAEFYSMAIFSQQDAQTREDFRRYNRVRPNRNVPYLLPSQTLAAARAFVKSAGLSTGSIDFLRKPDGQHVFLEVNPGGQFGFVSQQCNYLLEKHVARHLVYADRAGRDPSTSARICHVPAESSERVDARKLKGKPVSEGYTDHARSAISAPEKPDANKAGKPTASISAIGGDREMQGIRELFSYTNEDADCYPLGYRLMQTMNNPNDPGLRIGSSSFHRTTSYVCARHYKPISKPVDFGIPSLNGRKLGNEPKADL
jgi:ATP-GRASP peptide maturase of grasp-with-spasm system